MLDDITNSLHEQQNAISEPVTAMAVNRPCQLHKYHSPKPSRTEGHHRHPVYLQNQVYGHIKDPELLWVCGTCHDNIHEWLGWLLKESREPNPHPGTYAKKEAQLSFDWFVEAHNAR